MCLEVSHGDIESHEAYLDDFKRLGGDHNGVGALELIEKT